MAMEASAKGIMITDGIYPFRSVVLQNAFTVSMLNTRGCPFELEETHLHRVIQASLVHTT